MSVTSVANHPTSLKLPAALKAQLELDAKNAGLTLHAFMVQTMPKRLAGIDPSARHWPTCRGRFARTHHYPQA
jgi:hypothetical protein